MHTPEHAALEDCWSGLWGARREHCPVVRRHRREGCGQRLLQRPHRQLPLDTARPREQLPPELFVRPGCLRPSHRIVGGGRSGGGRSSSRQQWRLDRCRAGGGASSSRPAPHRPPHAAPSLAHLGQASTWPHLVADAAAGVCLISDNNTRRGAGRRCARAQRRAARRRSHDGLRPPPPPPVGDSTG